jgi:hypothetical protein
VVSIFVVVGGGIMPFLIVVHFVSLFIEFNIMLIRFDSVYGYCQLDRESCFCMNRDPATTTTLKK